MKKKERELAVHKLPTKVEKPTAAELEAQIQKQKEENALEAAKRIDAVLLQFNCRIIAITTISEGEISSQLIIRSN